MSTMRSIHLTFTMVDGLGRQSNRSPGKLRQGAGLKRAAPPQGLVNFTDGAQQRGSIVTSNFFDKLSLGLIPPWECFLEFASAG